MILKLIDEVLENEVLNRDVEFNGSILFKSGKELSKQMLAKLKEQSVPFIYVDGEPDDNQKIRQYIMEIKSDFNEFSTAKEKIDYLIQKQISTAEFMELFPFIKDFNLKKDITNYFKENFNYEIFNYIIKNIKLVNDSKSNALFMDIIEEKCDKDNIDIVVGLLDSNDSAVKNRVKKIIKNKLSLRKLYEIKNKFKKNGHQSDFFEKEINFLLMPPKYFWDKKIMIFSTLIEKHIILKSYLENLETIVMLTDYNDFDNKILKHKPYIIIFDLDDDLNNLEVFKQCSHKYEDIIYFILSSKVDKKLFWEATNNGANYFIKKPYSLPKIQTYLSTVIQHGKIIGSYITSNKLLKLDFKNFGNDIKKIDFFGDLIGFTVDEVSDYIAVQIKNQRYYFFDFANLTKIDSAGIRFLLKLKDVTEKSDSELFFLNCNSDVEKEIFTYNNILIMADKWEEVIWR
ncbi:MAG: STAS domain-containing protein [Candidatus Muirbacterium halophilum]|nr:STAS domain-containing protein [Candidatus Muirbacterium halophilum]MCK9477531.1 STAS domain-containing protein [Candidatus Muirbacterium halophilum]